ncbi:MAG: transglycosylase SLT domain-containing protein [Acidobacteria bacterium]|nr:transglycosylase SLT domain-containing protein [Acidobacteriota bacterium]
MLPRPTPSDLLIVKAEESFQTGKRSYQAGKREYARKQFDRALDLLFEASENPSDRHAFERKFEDTVDAIHRYDLSGLGPAASVEEPRFEKSPLEDILEMTFPVDPKLKRKVRDEVQATSSQLPLTVNDAVLGFVHYFSGRGRKTMIAGLQRAGRYRPMIQRILAEEGVPQELIHLAQAESGFLPRAVSRKKATGMWQFVQFRGQEYGLKQTPQSDDRLDPEKATRAAARHLRDLFERYGDWCLAVAAYNCGPGNVDRAIERTGYADFWELRSRRTLPLETTNYVPIILAMTIMVKNAREYELEGVVPDAAIEYDVLDLESSTNLALIADLTESSLPQLQALNPALLKGIAPPGYALRAPKGTANSLAAMLPLVPAEKRVSWRMHRVETGDTLEAIGKRYGMTPGSILAANHLTGAAPEAGELLVIPKPYAPPAAHTAVAKSRRTSASTAASGAARPGRHAAASRAPGARAAASRTRRGRSVQTALSRAPRG